MDNLYPNLYERFKSEEVCPICMMEMHLTHKYTCMNQHTICYRCKPYYYDCPICHSPLEMELPSADIESSYSPPLPTHFLPHPIPPRFQEHGPSAPSLDEFQQHERNIFPPDPSEDQELRACSYADMGCWVKLPIYLVDLHESRCQFRPHLEEEHLPTDVAHKQEDLVECAYRVVGCKVKTPPWRISIHESHCNYRDRFNEMNISDSFTEATIANEEFEMGDPEELVECRYRKYGCMVNMPRRRKLIHQEKCNYRKYQESESEESSSENEYDPDEQVPCRWSNYGCKVQPKRSRLITHEEKCNYKMEECRFKDNGCSDMFQPSKRYLHERVCPYAN